MGNKSEPHIATAMFREKLQFVQINTLRPELSRGSTQTSQEYFRLQCLISKPSWCCRQKPPKAQKPPGAARSPQEPPGATRSRQATSSYQEPARATQGSPRATRQPGATRRLADNRLLLLQNSEPHPKHFPQYNCMFLRALG